MKRKRKPFHQSGDGNELSKKHTEIENLAQSNDLLQQLYTHARIRQARTLHDGPTQSIAALAMQVNYARRLMEKDPQAAMAEFQEIEELARRTTIEMRHILYILHPLTLESAGLSAALESLVEKTGEHFNRGIETDIATDGSVQLNDFEKYLVFIFTVEALHNACEHSRAEKVVLRYTVDDGSAILQIEDDGDGFDYPDPEQPAKNNPTPGMMVMRQVVELLHGDFEIQTHKGEGTRMILRIPSSAESSPHE